MFEDVQEQIDQLNRQVDQLYQQGHYEEAIDIAIQIRDLTLQYATENQLAFINSLNNLAKLYNAVGNDRQAKLLYQQVWSMIMLQILGEKDSFFVTSQDNQAKLYQSMGEYRQAELLYRQTLAIRHETLGEKHPDFATNLNNLAWLYYTMGDYKQAEPLYQQALAIRREILGEKHLDVAISLNNLAALYYGIGDYKQAESLFQEGLAIMRKTLGENHPDVAAGLNNLAMLYYTMGDYKQAELLYQQALATRHEILGENHPEVATSLNNLAVTLSVLNKYKQAELLYQQAFELLRETLGERHSDVATILNNLAMLYYTMGDYKQAEALYQRGLTILSEALGENHPDVATNLNNLAMLYQSMGNYEQAELLYRQALSIQHNVLGQEHPDVAISLNNLATLYTATNRKVEARTLMEQVAAIDNRMIGQVFSIGSENQRGVYLRALEGHFDIFLSLVLQDFSHSSAAVWAGLNLVLRRKAIGVEALAAQRDAILGGRYPALLGKLKELTTLRTQIAQKTLAGPGREDLQEYQQLLAEWNTQKERLEAELTAQIPEMNLARKLQTVDAHQVAKALPEGGALVEFVRFNVFDFHAVPADSEPQWKLACYLAFILLAGDPDNVQMIGLGEAEHIDQMIRSFRASITSDKEYYSDRHVIPESLALSQAASRSDGSALRAMIFDPLVTALGDRRRLFLAPDGDLTRLPFEVLPTSSGGRLIDDYYISYLGTGRDALRFGEVSTGQPSDPLIAADPAFDLGDNDLAAGVQAVKSGGRHSRDLDRGILSFMPLPNTRVEGEQIAAMLGVQPLLAGRVLEQQIKARLKTGRSPRILHIATHGFFLADQQHDPKAILLGPKTLSAIAGDRMNWMSKVENPLLRSGLALAGANTWLRGGRLPSEAEDGLMTAEDVSGLDLLDTKLVVLSACETGLGEVLTGEGVFGLRRAFVVAGAKTLVMSLWKVPDQQTKELMTDFYRRILEGCPCPDALREAQQAMKDKYPHPYFWGAFICQGDPGPLLPQGPGEG